MYMSILVSFLSLVQLRDSADWMTIMLLLNQAGAIFGPLVALPLVCACVATGATICYSISLLLGPALLLASESWRIRLDSWRRKVSAQGGNMLSFLIVLR